MQIIKYDTEQEAQQIIADKTAQGLVLTHVSNITEGNFIGFMENPIPQPPESIDVRLDRIEDTQDLILLKLEGII